MLAICERFSKFPSELFAEPENLPGGGLLRLLTIEKLGKAAESLDADVMGGEF